MEFECLVSNSIKPQIHKTCGFCLEKRNTLEKLLIYPVKNWILLVIKITLLDRI